MQSTITKKSSILFNQLWICKAIEDGNYNFLPSRNMPNLSIGELIEARYESKPYAEQKSPKITKKNSILFEREWVSKAIEEGMPLPRRSQSIGFSLGEIIELRFFEREICQEQAELERNKVFEIKMGSEQKWTMK